MFWVYKTLQLITMTAFSIYYKLDYKGIENIPPKDVKYLVICNHRTLIDPILLSWHIKPMIRFMGKAELFEKQPLKWICEAIGGLPVARGTGDTSALDTSVEFYIDGELVGLFPEGTRSKDGVPLRPKSGATLIARMAEANVLPCAISFEGKLKFRSKITISYGELIKYEELGFEGDYLASLKKQQSLSGIECFQC